jgi:uncharacterized membrane protein
MKLPTLKSFVVGAVLLALIDLPWLLFIQNWGSDVILKIQGSRPALRYFPAALVYFFMSYILTFPTSYAEAFLLGSCVYGVYDATTYATLKGYDPVLAMADTTWGGVLLSTAWFIQKKYL